MAVASTLMKKFQGAAEQFGHLRPTVLVPKNRLRYTLSLQSDGDPLILTEKLEND